MKESVYMREEGVNREMTWSESWLESKRDTGMPVKRQHWWHWGEFLMTGDILLRSEHP